MAYSTNNSLFSLKAIYICFFVFVLVLGCSSSRSPPLIRKVECPFHLLLHTGDGFFDIGNAFQLGYLPVNNFPYGMTYPGYPDGRWCDGVTDLDIGGAAMGFTEITPYLGTNVSSSNATVFAVADSPVLDNSFFTSRGVQIPAYAASISVQLTWLKDYLSSICSTPTECAAKMGDSLFIFGDAEANDVTIPLTQGKSIQEAMTYVPFVTEAQINAAREVISMGSTRVILVGNAPMGCFPHILTELGSDDPTDYDDLGCLWKVNDLVKFKNNDFEIAINNLIEELPNVTIYYADIYSAMETIIQDSMSGPYKNETLKACCGIGGKYNFDRSRFCGTSGVPVCADTDHYIYWDGMHLTQEGNNLVSLLLQSSAFPTFNCTSSKLFSSI